MNRPPTARRPTAACLASIAALRSGPIAIIRGQPHPLGDRGRGGQRGERLDAVVDQPVEHAERGERPGVGASRPLDEQRARGARNGVGKPDADPHVRHITVDRADYVNYD